MLYCGLVEQRHRITAIPISKQIDVRKYRSKCKQGCNCSTLPIDFLFWKKNHVLTSKTCYFLPQLTLAHHWSRCAGPIKYLELISVKK